MYRLVRSCSTVQRHLSRKLVRSIGLRSHAYQSTKRSIHTITEFLDLTKAQKQSCRAETEQCLNEIQAIGRDINAFITTELPDNLYNHADTADQRIRDKQHRPLEGVLVAVKDNFCTLNLATTCASTMLQGFTAPFEANVITRLREAGAIIVGKTNMDEFGMGSANVFSVNGPVNHPVSVKLAKNDDMPIRTAGGSSGGSAAAVAAHLSHAAIGSDTGGSVRLPAAYCGIVGFKPSYGHCSRYGLVSYASSLDTVGILTRTAKDAHLLYDVMKGPDSRDASMANIEMMTQDTANVAKNNDLTGVVVGIPLEYYVEELSSDAIKTWQLAADHLQSLGATIKFVSSSSNLARYDGIRYGYRAPTDQPTSTFNTYANTRRAGFGQEVQRRILLGSFVLSESAYDDHFVQAQRIRRLIQQDFDQCFRTLRTSHVETTSSSSLDGVDVLLTPCNIDIAPTINEAMQGGVAAYANDVMTVPASLAGIPAISMPFTQSNDHYSINIQLMAQYEAFESHSTT
ncbi:aspartyl/glutamyl-tRNA amidotransferase subunit A [Syncephalis plumigaleata]|nr:aspartyl/glutamyl-tRNA amidotransferase subunit A [Syncephalis plumigaleata]